MASRMHDLIYPSISPFVRSVEARNHLYPLGSAMSSLVPSVTFSFGSDVRVTLSESLLASPPAGVTFTSITNSAFVTLGGPTPNEATAFSPPQMRGRAAMYPFRHPVAWRPLPRPLPVRPVVRRPVHTAPIAQVTPPHQCRQPAVITPIIPVKDSILDVVPPKVESQPSCRPQLQESSGALSPRKGEVYSTYGPPDKGKKPVRSSPPSRPQIQQSRIPYKISESQQSL
ncbi:uncharacterized protein LOC110111888 [Dendrobium catenatum]|uniref:uncharacterized protein LOC110111888 n=1 Tax=Dendrobium catenatum TaxID=906689 RepID=UPI0009F598F0|nr:uncharacterized protein LOC110111888 [Dendrobium catenatum]